MKFVNFNLNFFDKTTISGVLAISSNPKLPNTLTFDTTLEVFKNVIVKEEIVDHFKFIEGLLKKFKIIDKIETITTKGKTFYVDNATQRKKLALQNVASFLINDERVHVPEQEITVLNSNNENVSFTLSDLGVRFVPVVKNKEYTNNYFINNVFYFNDVDYEYEPKMAKSLNDNMNNILEYFDKTDSTIVYFKWKAGIFSSKLGKYTVMVKLEHFNK